MTSHGFRTIQAGFLAFAFAGSGCGLILGLDDFEDAPAAGSQSSGGTDDMGVCHPDTAERCYSGTPGTAEIGPCRFGIRTCDSSGERWGTCEDEVVPDHESCASDEDENCDGFDCALWAQAFDNEARIHSVATDRAGNIIAVGFFRESIQLDTEPGAEPLTGAGETDIFIVSLDRLGKHRWSYAFGDVATQEATAVSVDGSGNVIVAGVNDGTVDFGDINVGPGLFVAKFENDGKHLWTRSFSGNPINNDTTRPKIYTTQHGDIIASGTFRGNIRFDDQTLTTSTTEPEDTSDIYVIKLDGNTGNTRPTHGGWVRQFGGLGVDTLADADVDRSDNIVLTGRYNTSISFGGLRPLDGSGMFLTKLDRDGVPSWSRGFADAYPSALDVDTLSNISVTGIYDDALFSFAPNNYLPTGQDPLFVAQFNATGDHNWSRGFTSPHATGPGISASDIDTDDLNNLLITCAPGKSIEIDNETLNPSEYPYVLVLKMNSTGKTLWKKTYIAGLAYGTVATADHDSESIIAGRFSLKMYLETGTIETGEQYIDVMSPFIAKLGR